MHEGEGLIHLMVGSTAQWVVMAETQQNRNLEAVDDAEVIRGMLFTVYSW